MKKTLFLVASLIATYITPSYAAPLKSVQKVNVQEASGLQSIGKVSVSGINGGPSDAIRIMKDKTAIKGGNYIRIISLGTPSDSSLWRGNAEIYQ